MTAPQQFLTETRERFLRTILAQVPAGRIRELYLFQPIRQGGVESGVAVVAAYEDDTSAVDRRPSAEENMAVEENTSAVDGRASAVTTEPANVAEPANAPEAVDIGEVTGHVAEAESCEVAVAADGRRPTADELVAADGRRPTADAVQEKYVVYTARYRHTLKGPDRGKWEASIVAEAEAPLLSIESVVRGVQRRAGDVDPPDHMTAEELRAALRLEPAPSGT